MKHIKLYEAYTFEEINKRMIDIDKERKKLRKDMKYLKTYEDIKYRIGLNGLEKLYDALDDFYNLLKKTSKLNEEIIATPTGNPVSLRSIIAFDGIIYKFDKYTIVTRFSSDLGIASVSRGKEFFYLDINYSLFRNYNKKYMIRILSHEIIHIQDKKRDHIYFTTNDYQEKKKLWSKDPGERIAEIYSICDVVFRELVERPELVIKYKEILRKGDYHLNRIHHDHWLNTLFNKIDNIFEDDIKFKKTLLRKLVEIVGMVESKMKIINEGEVFIEEQQRENLLKLENSKEVENLLKLKTCSNIFTKQMFANI